MTALAVVAVRTIPPYAGPCLSHVIAHASYAPGDVVVTDPPHAAVVYETPAGARYLRVDAPCVLRARDTTQPLTPGAYRVLVTGTVAA